MSNPMNEKLKVSSLIVAVHADWDLRSTWKLIKPHIYFDEQGNPQTGLVKRMPDGEPTHWDIVMIRGNKDYYKVSEEICMCDLSSGDICVHWKELRV